MSVILKAGMQSQSPPQDAEGRAIARLIAEIDSLDALRDRVGRRVVLLFFAIFIFAIGLLIYAVTHSERAVAPPGPRVPGVLQRMRTTPPGTGSSPSEHRMSAQPERTTH